MCRDCQNATGGCWRHGINGIYAIDERGQLYKTHVPEVTDFGNGQQIYFYRPATIYDR